jgi:hypothetical protein
MHIHIPHLPGWFGPAAAVLLVVLLLSGPVRRRWRRLAWSLVAGLVAATGVCVWAYLAEHAALTAGGASAPKTLATIFAVVTIVVTAVVIAIGAKLGRKRAQSQEPPGELPRPVRYARRAARGGGAL